MEDRNGARGSILPHPSHFAKLRRPHPGQGVGWALMSAYPAAGEKIPQDMEMLLKKLDGDAD